MAADASGVSVSPAPTAFQPELVTAEYPPVNGNQSIDSNERTPLLHGTLPVGSVQTARSHNEIARARWQNAVFTIQQVPLPELLEQAFTDLQREELEAIDAARKVLEGEVALGRKEFFLNLLKSIVVAAGCSVAFYYALTNGDLELMIAAGILTAIFTLAALDSISALVNWRRLVSSGKGLPIGADAIGNLTYPVAACLTTDEKVRQTIARLTSLVVNGALRLGTGIVGTSAPTNLLSAKDVISQGKNLIDTGEKYIGRRINGLDITLSKLTELKRAARKERQEAELFRHRLATLYKQHRYQKQNLQKFRSELIKIMDDLKAQVRQLRADVRDDFDLAKAWVDCWRRLPRDTQQLFPELQSMSQSTFEVLHPKLNENSAENTYLLGIDPNSLNIKPDGSRPFVAHAERELESAEKEVEAAHKALKDASVHFAGKNVCFKAFKMPFAIGGFLGLGAAAALTVGWAGTPVVAFMLGNCVISVMDLDKAIANYRHIKKEGQPLPIGDDSIGFGFFESLKAIGVEEKKAENWAKKTSTLVRFLFSSGASATQSDVMERVKQFENVTDNVKPILEEITALEDQQKKLDKEELKLQIKLNELERDLKKASKIELEASSKAHLAHLENIQRVAKIKVNVQIALLFYYSELKALLPNENRAFLQQFIFQLNQLSPSTKPEVTKALKTIFDSLPAEAQGDIKQQVDVEAKLGGPKNMALEPAVMMTT
ncbi:hypothetical protein D5018_07370 [Parashewanella curva]|uniref:Uncharacterized protein n=1 Tax=Parashewanella curva TaxID=2338552 RepID=A0A3L8Q0M0_9GAMM|nr:hypothetical protein [Parashewanella curva]RLV60338.1 hypothetical protein D5018_07370 [Parashewanella curva]